uniref:Cytochrome c oxidase copper chaperone n=1 Tax=Angiostrongylus cantonensis TaxID=6313 RepID=A0A0K0DLH1_ANGCA
MLEQDHPHGLRLREKGTNGICARDQCIVENGEEHCGELIEAHKQCMRKAGFDI